MGDNARDDGTVSIGRAGRRLRLTLLQPDLMTPHVKVQGTPVQFGFVLHPAWSDRGEAGRAVLARAVSSPDARSIVAVEIAGRQHHANTLSDLCFCHIGSRL